MYFTLEQELLVHSRNESNVTFLSAKGSDPFPECGRAPNLNCTHYIARLEVLRTVLLCIAQANQSVNEAEFEQGVAATTLPN